MLRNLAIPVIVILLCFNSAKAAEALDWWEDATYYQVYPRSFMDSNGDGVGDLNGITSRLNYLKDLGITAVWVSPVFESPMVDMGYDVANFTNIDPIFGTLHDFDVLLKKAHKLGLKVILDFIPNHTSDKCEWFQKSIRREDGYDDFYVWADGKIDPETGERIPPSNWISRFNGSQWTWNEERQQYYLHQFFAQQPDLDLMNPKVRQRLIEVMTFWLDRGVDAFRVDAVPYFVETRYENGTFPDQDPVLRTHTYSRPENIELLYEWREFLDKYQQENGGDTRMMLAETYAPIEIVTKYIRSDTRQGSQMPMHLHIVKIRNEVNANVLKLRADYWMDVIWKQHKMANWAMGNHDNTRVATRMGYNRVDLMTILLYSLPGATFTYNGEEFGMTDGEIDCSVRVCDFRDPERTPLQWDNTKNAGFSKGDSTWLPVNPNYVILNMKSQRGKYRSNLTIYKAMLKLKQTPAFKAFKEDGGFEYAALNEQVFYILRTDKVSEEYRILANIGNQIEHVEGLTNKTMEYVVLNSYSPHKKGEKVDMSKRIYLMPFEAVVLRWAA